MIDLSGAIARAAVGQARKNELVVDDVITCWNCGARPALMPQLHCPPCLAEAWRRTGAAMACVSREQTPADVEAARV
jgi:hypothetical protein